MIVLPSLLVAWLRPRDLRTALAALVGGIFGPAGDGGPSPSGGPVRWDGTERLNVLLVGIDRRGSGANFNTDTMIVATLDPVGRTVSMLSVPRDLVDAPIPGGGTWTPKINGLAALVRWHPDQFPGSNGVGSPPQGFMMPPP